MNQLLDDNDTFEPKKPKQMHWAVKALYEGIPHAIGFALGMWLGLKLLDCLL